MDTTVDSDISEFQLSITFELLSFHAWLSEFYIPSTIQLLLLLLQVLQVLL